MAESPTFNANSVLIYKSGNLLHINSGTATMEPVNIFDIRGRLLYTIKVIHANATSLNDFNAELQVLLVQITTDENKMVTRKVVN